MTARTCSRCGVSEDHEMLAHSGGVLVCCECDSVLEREWVEDDPETRTHYLDTFKPYPFD